MFYLILLLTWSLQGFQADADGAALTPGGPPPPDYACMGDKPFLCIRCEVQQRDSGIQPWSQDFQNQVTGVMDIVMGTKTPADLKATKTFLDRAINARALKIKADALRDIAILGLNEWPAEDSVEGLPPDSIPGDTSYCEVRDFPDGKVTMQDYLQASKKAAEEILRSVPWNVRAQLHKRLIQDRLKAVIDVSPILDKLAHLRKQKAADELKLPVQSGAKNTVKFNNDWGVRRAESWILSTLGFDGTKNGKHTAELEAQVSKTKEAIEKANKNIQELEQGLQEKIFAVPDLFTLKTPLDDIAPLAQDLFFSDRAVQFLKPNEIFDDFAKFLNDNGGAASGSDSDVENFVQAHFASLDKILNKGYLKMFVRGREEFKDLCRRAPSFHYSNKFLVMLAAQDVLNARLASRDQILGTYKQYCEARNVQDQKQFRNETIMQSLTIASSWLGWFWSISWAAGTLTGLATSGIVALPLAVVRVAMLSTPYFTVAGNALGAAYGVAKVSEGYYKIQVGNYSQDLTALYLLEAMASRPDATETQKIKGEIAQLALKIHRDQLGYHSGLTALATGILFGAGAVQGVTMDYLNYRQLKAIRDTFKLFENDQLTEDQFIARLYKFSTGRTPVDKAEVEKWVADWNSKKISASSERPMIVTKTTGANDPLAVLADSGISGPRVRELSKAIDSFSYSSAKKAAVGLARDAAHDSQELKAVEQAIIAASGSDAKQYFLASVEKGKLTPFEKAVLFQSGEKGFRNAENIKAMTVVNKRYQYYKQFYDEEQAYSQAMKDYVGLSGVEKLRQAGCMIWGKGR